MNFAESCLLRVYLRLKKRSRSLGMRAKCTARTGWISDVMPPDLDIGADDLMKYETPRLWSVCCVSLLPSQASNVNLILCLSIWDFIFTPLIYEENGNNENLENALNIYSKYWDNAPSVWPAVQTQFLLCDWFDREWGNRYNLTNTITITFFFR